MAQFDPWGQAALNEAIKDALDIERYGHDHITSRELSEMWAVQIFKDNANAANNR